MAINWNDIKDKVNYYLIILIAFFLPLKKEVIPPLIILFFISSLFNKRKNLFKGVKPSYFIIMGFYFFGILSLFYGKNIDNTNFNNEIKLSLLAFPLSFFINNLNIKKIYRSVFKAFIEGTFISVVLSLLNSLIIFYYEREISVFFYDHLAFFSHASYFSMYLNFAIGLLYYFWFSPSKKDYIKPYINFSISFFLSIIVLMLASKTGIFTLLLIHLIAAFYWTLKYKKIKQGLILIASITAVVVISLTYSPQVLERIVTMKESIQNFDGKPNTSTKTRLAVWKESYTLIKDSPIIGYGTGDVMDILTEKYKEKGFHDLAKKHLNSHNQFIQILLGSGFIGLIYFLFLIAYPYLKNLTSSQYLLYTIFTALIILNFLTESMLETQSGVVFFSFFITIFYSLQSSKENLINKI